MKNSGVKRKKNRAARRIVVLLAVALAAVLLAAGCASQSSGEKAAQARSGVAPVSYTHLVYHAMEAVTAAARAAALWRP